MKSKIVFILLALFLLSSIAVGQAVPAKNQVILSLKIASMDRNFGRFGDPVKIGVSSDGMLSEFKAQSKLKVKGKPIAVEKMGSLDDMDKFKVVYIDKNWSGNYAAAAEKAKAGKILIFAADPNFVEAGGGAVAFKVVSGKARIVLNLANVKEQGSDFPANFLKITVVVGGLK
ncbi:MAG: YfiR family protein [bacterium]|nr:YfiR family protein [bacterium]